jgi:aminoglycoside phosphotransferase (APT) family kinase protein
LQLPDFPQVSAEALRTIAERHGLDAKGFSRLRNVGIFNTIYLLGSEYVLRVPRNAPPFVDALRKESIAVPAARATGVRTPALVAFDDSLELLPVPYAVYERVHGETLGLLDLEPTDTPGVWREVGRDLARLHEGVSKDGPVAELELEPLPDPRSLPDELASAGYFTSMEARWLSAWLDELAPAILAPVEKRFRHGDIQTTNVMVRPGSLDYLALIDWGACGWGDPAHDFAGIPLRAVPSMLAGYRELALLPEDEMVEARIVWRHLQISLYLLSRPPQPGLSWAERPTGMFMELMRFFLDPPEERWSVLREGSCRSRSSL